MAARTLCTFSGQFGDLLWSLPTVRRISTFLGKVDFATMPSSRTLVPLISQQSYINKAFVIENWIETGRPFGCQPWQSPDFEGRAEYKRVYDLSYREHPYGKCLADWIAASADYGCIVPSEIPFVETDVKILPRSIKRIAFAFKQDLLGDTKTQFMFLLKRRFASENVEFIDTTIFDWPLAAEIIKASLGFVGCRSSNYVLAYGVGARVLEFEPYAPRTGLTFSCPFGHGVELPGFANEQVVDQAELVIRGWIDEFNRA